MKLLQTAQYFAVRRLNMQHVLQKKNANSFLTIFGRPQDKIKLSLCTPRRYIEGEEEEEEVYLHTFLTSELDEVWWSRTKQNRLLCFD